MKILHVLETSVPNTVGYTVRAKAIVEHQRRLGLDPVVITSPLFQGGDPAVTQEEYDGTRYHRTNYIRAPGSARRKIVSHALRVAMLMRYRRAVLDVARREKVQLIHAHSSYSNAYAAMPAARRLGLPLIYEVRTLWGESAVVEDGWRADSLKHRMIWRLELGAMNGADLVVPIAKGIRDELASRGIPERKLRIVPNGVDSSLFRPVAPDRERARASGVENRFVVGFVGSMRRLEGLDLLVEAYRLCRMQRADIGLVIVGDGPVRTELEARARTQGLDAVFTGAVPHSEVSSWYSIMDVVAYPRIRAVINERVTPLKPLEAMSLDKVCIGSDVGGLTELIEDGVTGAIFKAGDAAHLAATILDLASNPEKLARLRAGGREFVHRERQWPTIVSRYLPLYEEAADLRRRR